MPDRAAKVSHTDLWSLLTYLHAANIFNFHCREAQTMSHTFVVDYRITKCDYGPRCCCCCCSMDLSDLARVRVHASRDCPGLLYFAWIHGVPVWRARSRASWLSLQSEQISATTCRRELSVTIAKEHLPEPYRPLTETSEP